MSGKDSVEFTVKGPISVQRHPQDSGTDQKKTGCSIIDLHFQHPYQLGEIVFTNYYTAFLSIYIKRLPRSKGSSNVNTTEFSTSATSKNRAQLERSATIDGHSGGLTPCYKIRSSQEDEEKCDTKCGSQKLNDVKKRNNAGGQLSHVSDLNDRAWECSIYLKTLMPWPHFDLGSQDRCSIQATESLVEWRDVVIMRLVIHQPSTVWKRFCVDDIYVYRNLPKRGFSQCDELLRQKDGWFSMLKVNTKKMLSGQLVEPDTEKSDERM